MSALDQFRVGSPLAKLLAGRVRPHKLFSIEITRVDGRATLPLAVRSLTADDAARAHADAIKWLVSTGGWQREDLIGDAGDAILNLEVMVPTLNGARRVQEALKTLAEVKEVADALGKGQASMTSLPRYEYTTLRSIITALVDQRATWTMPSSSGISPQTVSPVDSSESWTPTMTIGEE